ncbi:MAG: hypothetical protein LBB61_06425 [Treponema sp.]|jgi:hypothetical protein|nr:hypothetical protein [Treponema sp.]
MELTEKHYLQRVFKVPAGESFPVSGVCALDSMMIETHPDAHGSEKNGTTGDREESSRMERGDTDGNRGGMGGRKMAAFRLSEGNVPDTVEGRLPPETIGIQGYTVTLLMNMAYDSRRSSFDSWEYAFNPPVVRRMRVETRCDPF